MTTFTKQEAMDILYLDFFKKGILRAEEMLTSSSLHHNLSYHKKAINKSLKSTFDDINNLLQVIVDKFSEIDFNVKGYMPISVDNFKEAKKHNLSIINSIKKLINKLGL